MTTEIKVKIQKCDQDAWIPEYQTTGAACFDFHSLTEGTVTPSAPLLCRTGIKAEIPDGHVMLIFSRSGHGFKNNTRLANCVGVIDSDYRGEIMVKLTQDADSGALHVSKHDRIAQGMVIPIHRVVFEVVEDLSDTHRGEGGFGSTGK